LEARGAFDAARVAYEDFIVKSPESPWEGQVRTALQNLDMKKRAATPQPPVLASPPALPAALTAPSVPTSPKK